MSNTDFMDAVGWAVNGYEFCMFAAHNADAIDVPLPVGPTEPTRTRRYELDQAEGSVSWPVHFTEIDLIFEHFPEDVDDLLTAWLHAALESGASAAWFGFEGTFDFSEILTRTAAPDVYALADHQTSATALRREERRSDQWGHAVTEVGHRLADRGSRV